MVNPFEESIEERYAKYRCPTHGEITGNGVLVIFEDGKTKWPRCIKCYWDFFRSQLPELTVLER